MKKIRNFVIGGIENKVFNLILFTVLLLTAAFTAVSVYHGKMLERLAEESSVRQQEAIREISGSVMDSVVEQSMSRSTQEEAYIADELFRGLKTRVEMMGTYAEKLFSDPDAYPRVSCAAPNPAREGEIIPQLIFADNADPADPALQDAIGLAANLSDLMVSLYGVSAETNSCFIALPDGAFLITDDRAAQKFDEKGHAISYDPRTRPWYRLAIGKGGLIFTDVETDAFTGDIGIVCAMPVYVNGKLKAVVGSDLFLTSMQDAVQASEASGRFLCVINQNGHVVFSPKKEGEFMVRPATESADLLRSDNQALSGLLKDSIKGITDLRVLELADGSYYAVGAPMETVGWTLLSLCSKAAAEQPTLMLQNSYRQIQEETAIQYQNGTKHSQMTAQALLIAVALAMLGGALILGKKIITPLNAITKKISELNEARPEFKMEDRFRTGDEIEVLAESFAGLSHKTIEYVETVKRVTAEKERIGTELALANDIQTAMLPHIFPAFPERREFDIYASMDPAKEVGGDFYDFFLIDDDHLCTVIADVSGKGVPAALFMMASKIILQSCAMLGSSAGEILSKMNTALCSNNEAEMFVTVWLGILEISTGKMIAANAGHEYPVLKHPDGSFQLFKDRHGFVVGGMEGQVYREYELQLEPGSKLFVYTDGVPEAANTSNELYGTDRLVEALNECKDAAPHEILHRVRENINAFVGKAEQFDDLTMLCMQYNGKKEE